MKEFVQNQAQLEALARLLEVAQHDTGQSRRVADFLLAWNNAEKNGGWNPYDLSNIDVRLADDVIAVLSLVRAGNYPDSLGFEREIVRCGSSGAELPRRSRRTHEIHSWKNPGAGDRPPTPSGQWGGSDRL